MAGRRRRRKALAIQDAAIELGRRLHGAALFVFRPPFWGCVIVSACAGAQGLGAMTADRRGAWTSIWRLRCLPLAILGCAACRSVPDYVPPPHPTACEEAAEECLRADRDERICRGSQAVCFLTRQPMPFAPTRTTAPDRNGAMHVIGGHFPLPSATPEHESVVTGVSDAQAKTCLELAHRQVDGLPGGRIERVLITRSRRFGTVWRADFSLIVEGAPYLERLVCSRWAFITGPVEYFAPLPDGPFDPGQAIRRLPQP